MINVKTYLTVQHQRQKYQLWGGQNRVNSDYLYMVNLPDKSDPVVARVSRKTGKTTFTDAIWQLPDAVSQKIFKSITIINDSI